MRSRRPSVALRRPMRALAAAALILPSASGARAQADGDEALGLLRAASAQSAIIVFCAKRYAVDGTTALRISQTSRDVAAKVLGRERADAAFKDELARRYDEVREVGEERWCAEQRAAFAQDGIRIFRD